jgi:2-polyprenyl-3-methyl-5-hydroxy-6-metoxy-1,4-benzoquinol methylase
MATRAYSSPTVIFAQKLYPLNLPEEVFDFVVSLESIEYIEDGEAFFTDLVTSLKYGGTIVFSTPCEDNLLFANSGNKFHFKHYTLKETLALVTKNGLSLLNWAGQNTYELDRECRPGMLLSDDAMSLKDRVAGQFTIAAARKHVRK